MSPQDVQSVIAAAACERDRLLLTTLWATGARISEVVLLWARLRTEYLALSHDEARVLMEKVPE